MRGKALLRLKISPALRITPACAGKSESVRITIDGYKDHPRVCGEKRSSVDYHKPNKGSPPRVRGKGGAAGAYPRRKRITPACAGKSLGCHFDTSIPWDHPRVCGEKALRSAPLPQPLGSPPRVRGKVMATYIQIGDRRITPACAGKRGGSQGDGGTT